MDFINTSVSLQEGPANITIPVDQIANIQAAIIKNAVIAEIIFFFVGVGVTLVFCYLYFRLWKQARGIDQEKDSEVD
jgi:hypothetical protein